MVMITIIIVVMTSMDKWDDFYLHTHHSLAHGQVRAGLPVHLPMNDVPCAEAIFSILGMVCQQDLSLPKVLDEE